MDKLSGYTEINLGGELRALKFGMGAWAIIAEERQKTLEEMFNGLSEFSFIGWVAYAGLKFAALAGYTDKEPPASVYVVLDWLDSADAETMAKIGKTFANSRTLGHTMQSYVDKMQSDGGELPKKKRASQK